MTDSVCVSLPHTAMGLTVQWVDIQCVIAVFPGHSHLYIEMPFFQSKFCDIYIVLIPPF